MGAHTYRELTTWQISDELRREVIAVTAREEAQEDRRFCQSLRSAAGSVCRNLAEGFARRNDREFAQFIRIALGSLAEVDDHLHEALERRLIAVDDATRLRRVGAHATAAALKLLHSLDTTPRKSRQ